MGLDPDPESYMRIYAAVLFTLATILQCFIALARPKPPGSTCLKSQMGQVCFVSRTTHRPWYTRIESRSRSYVLTGSSLTSNSDSTPPEHAWSPDGSGLIVTGGRERPDGRVIGFALVIDVRTGALHNGNGELLTPGKTDIASSAVGSQLQWVLNQPHTWGMVLLPKGSITALHSLSNIGR